jgi:hypothetical protein
MPLHEHPVEVLLKMIALQWPLLAKMLQETEVMQAPAVPLSCSGSWRCAKELPRKLCLQSPPVEP